MSAKPLPAFSAEFTALLAETFSAIVVGLAAPFVVFKSAKIVSRAFAFSVFLRADPVSAA